MALRDILEIVTTYLQYVVLMISIRPSPFPWYYRAPLDFLSYLNLDFEAIFGGAGGRPSWVPGFLPVDVRLQFIVISVLVPLLLAHLRSPGELASFGGVPPKHSASVGSEDGRP